VIVIKSSEEIAKIKAAGSILAEVFLNLQSFLKPGISTLEIDRMAERVIRRRGARPAFKGYRGFPATLCISLNNEVVHGIPGKRKLLAGDIVSIDAGVILNGWYADAAKTFPVGQVGKDRQQLMGVTEEALYKGIKAARAGRRLSDIGHAIQTHVEAAGFSVVRDFVGHGIGQELHEEPQIPNFASAQAGIVLQRGMVLAIEPMINAGKYEVEVLTDGWTVITQDGSDSAHFEHTVAVTDGDAEVLTA
jgi:methionyl aminopeptidase